VVNLLSRFSWYELTTTDVQAAKRFYSNVMGWGVLDAPVPDRTIFIVYRWQRFGRRAYQRCEHGCGLDRYIGVDDVDATANQRAFAVETGHLLASFFFWDAL
jgi:predicted enzyme related to lactoylglutathione lyase